MDVKGLEAALAAGAFLVDVRTPEEYAAGHVPSAKNIPVDQIEARLADVGPTDREVYLICASGRRSAAAGATLSAKGYKAVNVTGGTNAWKAAGLPVE